MKLALMAFASILVVGHRCVGKETIITRFLEHIPFTFFPHSNVFRCRFWNNSFFTITDISINEYNGDLENLIQNSTAFIYIYSITSKESFALEKFHEMVVRVKGTNSFPFVLVGHKCDKEEKRRVSVFEGFRLSKIINCKFFETCNLLDVDPVFDEVLGHGYLSQYKSTKDIPVEPESEPEKERKKGSLKKRIKNILPF